MYIRQYTNISDVREGEDKKPLYTGEMARTAAGVGRPEEEAFNSLVAVAASSEPVRLG